MTRLTVKQLAKLSGVSVRALHHYDAIGLLRPAFLGTNGYRYYEEAELLRLQQILIYRELDIPLGRIAALLDGAGDDRIAALSAQRAELVRRASHTAELIRTIDRTIARLNGDASMTDKDLYRGISPEKQRQYEAWLIATYGDEMKADIVRSTTALNAMSGTEREDLMAELADIESAWAGAMKNGIPADSTALDPLLHRHRAWVTAMWSRACSPEAYAGLADLHLGHPDFVARYDAVAVGFSDYHAAAMKAFAGRLGE